MSKSDKDREIPDLVDYEIDSSEDESDEVSNMEKPVVNIIAHQDKDICQTSDIRKESVMVSESTNPHKLDTSENLSTERVVTIIPTEDSGKVTIKTDNKVKDSLGNSSIEEIKLTQVKSDTNIVNTKVKRVQMYKCKTYRGRL